MKTNVKQKKKHFHLATTLNKYQFKVSNFFVRDRLVQILQKKKKKIQKEPTKLTSFHLFYCVITTLQNQLYLLCY